MCEGVMYCGQGVCVCVHSCMYVCVYAGVCVCMPVCVCVCVGGGVCVHTGFCACVCDSLTCHLDGSSECCWLLCSGQLP